VSICGGIYDRGTCDLLEGRNVRVSVGLHSVTHQEKKLDEEIKTSVYQQVENEASPEPLMGSS